MNMFKVAILVSMQVGLVATGGLLLGDVQGMFIAAMAAICVIAITSARFKSNILDSPLIREADPVFEAELINVLHRLAGRAGVATPKLYIFQHAEPNALSLGYTGSSSAVIVTSGLMQLLSKEQVAGVLAHELAHIRRRDAELMTLIAALTSILVGIGAILFIIGRGIRGGGAVAFIVVGLIGALSALTIRFTIGRETEYAADRVGVDICGHPEWLISALEAMLTVAGIGRTKPPAFAPALLSLLFIPGGPSVTGLFASHPPILMRIARLSQLCAGRAHALRHEEAAFRGAMALKQAESE